MIWKWKSYKYNDIFSQINFSCMNVMAKKLRRPNLLHPVCLIAYMICLNIYYLRISHGIRKQILTHSIEACFKIPKINIG